ncbi:MAG: hypothetical protein ACE5HI_15630 [bacterium]
MGKRKEENSKLNLEIQELKKENEKLKLENERILENFHPQDIEYKMAKLNEEIATLEMRQVSND